MKTVQVIFVPAPAIGHLVSMVEMARLLITRYQHLSATILVANFAYNTGVASYVESLTKNPSPRFKIIQLPDTDPTTYMSSSRHYILTALLDSQKPNIRNILHDLTRTESESTQHETRKSDQSNQFEGIEKTSTLAESTRLAAFVVDLLSVTIMDIGDELSVPTYVYCPAGANFLSLGLHFQSLRDDHNNDLTEFNNSDKFLNVPSFSKPVPAKVLPSMLLDKEGGSDLMLGIFKRFRDAKGIIINSFVELESLAFHSLAADPKVPKVYSVGPILNVAGEGHDADEVKDILGWLDCQPPSSVVFLCFGSFGGFHDNQLKETAVALESSGHRFLWSIRPPLARLKTSYPNLDEILPSGFLERTASIGKVIGWAPQVTVLSHNAVGGFVSHCGWNSTMESTWHGVPIATWPIYAEQPLNAFELVHELGLAIEVEMEYSNEFSMVNNGIVKAKELEVVIRKLMLDENASQIRKKVNKMKELCRVAVAENGSSYASLGQLVEDIIQGKGTCITGCM
ncbi:Glycosyltransferase [Heracleum sosnowskyi]|uniref:Glycosyltransferase n=1 Tax=Heracleum sosnowskyi TaxID=360622 RepID=A0AAD8MJM3_9APIA|nr:Glycosyltransferase [Heracleum sosnowskyi]